MTSVPTIDSGRPSSGFLPVLLGTAIAGICGYVITWLVPRQIGFADYTTFAVFWAFLFLIVSALSGIQQEVTRATRSTSAVKGPTSRRARNFGIVAAVSVFVLIVGSAALWHGEVFPGSGWALVWPLAVGASSYVMVAVLYGSLYGISQMRALFWLLSVEALLRVGALGIALIFTDSIAVLAWTVALPYAVTLASLWPSIRRVLVGRAFISLGYRALTWNIGRTILAAAAMGSLVSGYPLLLGLTTSGESAELVGLLILAATLTRAPLIVVAMAFQSFLVVKFRDSGDGFWRRFFAVQGLLLAAGLVIAVLGWFWGPWAFEVLFPDEIVPEGELIATLVISAVLVGELCVSAPAVLARDKHGVYAAGWVSAAIVTVVCLMLPVDLEARVVLSLLVGPAAGLLVHLGYLFRVYLARNVSTFSVNQA